ncbi:Nuclear transcription factor Y subunit B-4 [Bienertia sinuspersici]
MRCAVRLKYPTKSQLELENEAFEEIMYQDEIPDRPVGYGPGVKKGDIYGVRGVLRKEVVSAVRQEKSSPELLNCTQELLGTAHQQVSDKCHKENRKTVSGDDICWALTTLGFDNYGEAITQYLHKYREFEREKACQGKAVEEEEEGGVLLFGNNSFFSNQEIRDDEAMFGNEEGKDDQLPNLEFTIIDPKGKSPLRNNP